MYITNSRTRKSVPSRHNILFNKSKHSEDWHLSIDAIAGVLHPSDPKFSYPLLRQATDAYLRKKGKISQADIDVRLAILIESHEARDIAVAAAACTMTAGSLRTLLHVDLNVAHGSYWGLDVWLQCLIAANHENPASVTDLEATWAQHLLPFASYGPEAAGKVLIGVSRALRETAIPNMNIVSEFLTLTSRAVTDYGAFLERLRLKNNWTAAYGASYWTAELGRTSPAVTPPGHLLPEHILDAQFPIWRVWASWRPDLRIIQILNSVDSNSASVFSDLLSLEGPDFAGGTQSTLREGLIEQYKVDRKFLKFGGLVIEVPDRSKEGLREILESAISTLGSILTTAVSEDRKLLLRFFAELVVVRSMTQAALNLVQAILFISGGIKSGLGPDLLNSVLHVYTQRDELDGSHIRELQDLLQLFDRDGASNLRRVLFTPALLQGIARCIEDGQTAVRTLVTQGLPWKELAIELHTFCAVLKASKSVPVVGEKAIEMMCLLLPSAKHFTLAIEIHTVAQATKPLPPQQSTGVNGSTEGMDIKDILSSPMAVSAPAKLLNDDSMFSIEEIVEQYISHRLLLQPPPSYMSQRTFEAMLRVWETTHTRELDEERRSLAMLVADFAKHDPDLRIRCLNGIATSNERLSPGLSVQETLAILQGMQQGPEHGLVKLIRLLASCPVTQDFGTQISCWRDLAYYLLAQEGRPGICKDARLLDHALNTMDSSEWLSFLVDTQLVFASGPPLPPDDCAIPPILQPELQKHWAGLTSYTNTLKRLEIGLGNRKGTMKLILSCSGPQSHDILCILQKLKLMEQEPFEPFLHTIVSAISINAENAWQVSKCLSTISEVSLEAVEVCKKIWDAKHGFMMIPGISNCSQWHTSVKDDWLKPVTARALNSTTQPQTLVNTSTLRYSVPDAVVEVMVAGWLLDDNAPEDTKNAVRSISSLLMIEQTDLKLSKEKLLEAAVFFQALEDELIQEANRLATLRKALKKKDPQGTSLLFQQIGVPDTTELDEEISKLPPEVMDVVERLSDNEVEITFSLAAFTQLQRAAMGIPASASTLSLQLFLDCSKKSPPAFCIHYNNDQHSEAMAHSRYECHIGSENPTRQICTSAQTAFTWQLSRIIYSKLRRGQADILGMHQSVTAFLPDLAQFCVSCSVAHDSRAAQLRRSVPCDLNLNACAQLWYGLPLHVRIPEIRTDTFAVDIALSSVYTAAVTYKSELLQGCPLRSFQLVRSVIDALPTMSIMRDAVNLSSVLNSYHPQAEKLISWAVVQHRGFLATATGLLKIPNLPPGTHQFVLANASPKLETTFARKIQANKKDTTVLFHGTSLDRLPAILAQGMRIYSGTPLQRTGAVHGKGIYLSEDPATSFYYSTASLSWKNSGLNNMRMMLGCELVGTASKVNGNIHVVTDVETLMVRYILLFTKVARMPIRGHVEPAMASGMKALRSGAV